MCVNNQLNGNYMDFANDGLKGGVIMIPHAETKKKLKFGALARLQRTGKQRKFSRCDFF